MAAAMTDPQKVLESYGLTEAYPNEWPADKNESDDSEEEKDAMKAKINRRKSRYQALEKAINKRQSFVPGSEKSSGGTANLVQRDEPDPLGTTESVVRVLRSMGLPVQDDHKLRNRFLLSSTSFSPALFLSQVHASADTRALMNGMEVLQRSIDQKSASLKVLVESNFERFVRAKATIDNVYKEMKYRGAEPPTTRPRSHSRHASRTGFRASTSGPGNMQPSNVSDNRKKNALVRESEYGVMGIKAPLLEAATKAEDVWGPALGGREKEETLKTVGTLLDKYKEYFETSASITDGIKRKDHETVVEEYTRARKFADEARQLASSIGPVPPTDSQLYQILLAARMWYDVDEQITAFKKEVWKRLISLHTTPKSDAAPGQPRDQHMELIGLLMELGVEDNPIWLWLLSRYDHLKSKIQTTSERSKVEIEVLRRRLANVDKPTPQTTAAHFRNLGRQSLDNKPNLVDSPDVIELWEKILSFLTNMLSTQGILGEVLDFWHMVRGFLDGTTQNALPAGYNDESRQHHQISQQGATDLQRGVVELVGLIRESVYVFFVGPPPEDISALFSPLPQSPSTPMSANISGSLTPTALRDPRFNFDANNMPPPSPRRGEAWEKYAFWPPWSNSVSGVYYLSRMLTFVGSGAAEMASIDPIVRGTDGELDKLRNLVAASRERCVSVICGAWNRDAENIKFVEDWVRSPENRDVTRMPSLFSTFEGALLGGMQKILYISEAMSQPGADDIVLPPPNKQLQSVRAQYVNTIYKALSGMVENAERSVRKTDDEWTTDAEAVAAAAASSSMMVGQVDPGDRNVRMLLTLSNLQSLRSEVVPSLNGQFENAFSVKLTDESKTISDVLGQIDAKLFQSYTRQYVEALKRVVRTGISATDWAPPASTKPAQVRPYVYEALLSLVLVHSQVSTTSPSLTPQVLSFLLEQTTRELLDSFKARARYNLAALMQATLDVEFVAQTLSQYTSDRAAEMQSQIYQELDSRTDNDARTRLQAELPEMRAVLKRLREQSRNEFACFRKPKRGVERKGTQDGSVGQDK